MDAAVSSNEGRRLETPSREKLLAHYAQTEAFSKIILAVEIAVGLLALWWIFQKAPRPFGVLPWIAFAVGGLGVFRWFIHHVFLNKKRLEGIRPDAQFGEHNRDSLLKLTNGVFARLGLKPQAAPVFLTRAKDVNAAAVRCELWPGVHLFNGVFLNRSILHLLDERELASVIGHELGHVFPYAPLLSRCYVVHSLCAALVCFSLTAAFPFSGVALIAPLGILWLLDLIVAFPHLRLSRGIEFLCDDFGAQAAGLLPALSCEFKIAAEQETRQQLLFRLLEVRQGGAALNLHDLVETYEEAIPFGKADPESFEQDFKRLTSEKQTSGKGISVGGFLRHLQGNEVDSADDAVQEQLEQFKLLNSLPVLPLDRSLYVRGSRTWSLEIAEQLVFAITNDAKSVLTRSETEVDDRTSTHPNVSRRILFLWQNREMYPSDHESGS